MLFQILLTLLLGVSSSAVFALPFKCDKSQIQCEVQTKRWTVGDKVVILNDDKQLIAVGEVFAIKGGGRVVKITEKWSQLSRNHDMEIIKDEEFENPLKFYKSIPSSPEWAWGARTGMISLEVGDTFVSNLIEIELSRLLVPSLYVTVKLHYLSGKGQASDNLGLAGIQNVSVSTYGLTSGIAYFFNPSQIFSIRAHGDLGLSNSSVDLNEVFDVKKVLNNRIQDGTGVFANLGAAVVWRREGMQPEFGFNFLRLHQSNNPGIFLGFISRIR